MARHDQAPQGGVPQQALAYLAAVRNYYQPSVTRPPRNADIAAAHVPRLNARTWDRRKALLRDGRLGGRDWIEVWPPPRDWHPTWEHLVPLQPALPEGDELVHLVVDEAYDKNGKLVERRLLRAPNDYLATLAAGVAVYTMLDASDGRYDGIVHMCKLIAAAARLLT